MNKDKEIRIAHFASLLEKALNDREAVNSPITAMDPGITIDDAYAIQMINVNKALAQGGRISGKKIGLTSLAMQNVFNVSEPDYGHLFEIMDVTGKAAPMDRLLQPKVEGEIAFILKEDICGPNVTVADVVRATDTVVGSIEIVDSRIRDWKIKLIDTVSDNASSGLYVLGSKRFKLDEINLLQETMKFYKNGAFVNEGSGADVMGNPAACVAWLANKMGEYGVVLKKGEVVLSGALSAAVPAARGDRFDIVFSNLGTVSVEFV